MSGLWAALAVGVVVALVWLALAAKLVRDEEENKEEVEVRRHEIDRARAKRRSRDQLVAGLTHDPAAKAPASGEQTGDAPAPAEATGESPEDT